MGRRSSGIRRRRAALRTQDLYRSVQAERPVAKGQDWALWSDDGEASAHAGAEPARRDRSGRRSGRRAPRGACATRLSRGRRGLHGAICPAKRKPRTAESYRCLLEKYVLPELGKKRIVDIGRADVARLHSSLGETPRQANAAVSVISAVWGWAARREETEFAKNPAGRLERFPEKRWERYLSREEMAQLGEALQRAETEGIPWADDEPQSKHGAKPENRRSIFDPFAVATIRLLILTGMRPREVLNLEWRHVDFERGALFLPDSKTGRKTVILGGPALRLLSELPRVDGCPFVIAGRSPDKPRADLNRPWVAVRRFANLEGVRLYDLRHSFASVGAGASLGLPIVGKLLGHSQPATTNRYAHLDADPLHHAADAISTSIAASMASRLGSRPRAESPEGLQSQKRRDVRNEKRA